MNRKLKRLFRQNIGVFFFIILGFVIAAALTNNYALAAGEAGVTVVLLIGYLVAKNQRRKDLQAYLQSVTDSMNTIEGAASPLPIVVVRLEDNGVIHVNDRFASISGFKDTFRERTLQELLPGFSTDWLSSGKNE